MDIDNPPRVIVVTSPLPGDGKSTIAVNLAAALSMSDRRVVLIDGDLRRPVMAESFGLIEGLGLTDVLIGSVEFDEVAQPAGGLPNLRVLAAGRIPPNPSEMLGSQAMRRLLQRLAADHTVIVDAPPLLPVTDAAVLTASADGALVVVSAGQTLDTQLRDALANLGAVQGHTLGVVLNRVSPKSSNAGYYGGYYGPWTDERGEHPAPAQQQARKEPADLPAGSPRARSAGRRRLLRARAGLLLPEGIPLVLHDPAAHRAHRPQAHGALVPILHGPQGTHRWVRVRSRAGMETAGPSRRSRASSYHPPPHRSPDGCHPGRRLTAWGSRLGDARRLCRQPVPGRPALRPRDRERPDPQPRPGWSVVTLRTVGLNHHDIFSLKGVGLPADRLPMVLGCDGAGVDEDGNEVIVHAVVPSQGWQGDETLDPKRLLLSEPTTAPLPRRSPSPRPTWSASPPACPGSTRPACPPRGSRPTGCSSPTPASRPARPCSCRAPAGEWPPRSSSRLRRRLPHAGHQPRRGQGQGPSRSAPTARSAAASDCPSGSTPSWRPSAPPRGRTRSTRSTPAARSSSPAPPRATPSPRPS